MYPFVCPTLPKNPDPGKEKGPFSLDNHSTGTMSKRIHKKKGTMSKEREREGIMKMSERNSRVSV